MPARQGSGRLRIIAGSRRGHRIEVPRQGNVRPTGDRVREAIFAALFTAAGPVQGMRVLDLFAGTGALGLEALSRDARSCTFVESDARVARVLTQNVEHLDFAERSEVLRLDYRAALKVLGRRDPYDLLFLDPPYRMLAEVTVPLKSVLPRLLSKSGLVVVEGPAGVSPDLPLEIVFERKYGDTVVTMAIAGGEAE